MNVEDAIPHAVIGVLPELSARMEAWASWVSEARRSRGPAETIGAALDNLAASLLIAVRAPFGDVRLLLAQY